jgi:hypothetical protein
MEEKNIKEISQVQLKLESKNDKSNRVDENVLK